MSPEKLSEADDVVHFIADALSASPHLPSMRLIAAFAAALVAFILAQF